MILSDPKVASIISSVICASFLTGVVSVEYPYT